MNKLRKMGSAIAGLLKIKRKMKWTLLMVMFVIFCRAADDLPYAQQTEIKTLTDQQQQGKRIIGTVKDVTGEPVAGASVIEKGTTNGTATDGDGKFTLTVANENAILTVHFIGFKPLNIGVSGGDNKPLEITLLEDTQALEEVVVVGYGTVSKKDLTTAVAKVNVDEVPRSAMSNLTQALLGRAAGVQSTIDSSEPGGKINISIRGAGTPIYVVDGVVLPSSSLDPTSSSATQMVHFPANTNRSPLAGINPEDVESVEILKDASASIYGIDAARGVILITTKKGKSGALQIDYSGSQSYVTNYDFPDLLNAQEYMGLVNIFSRERYLYANKIYPYGTEQDDNKWTPFYTDAEISAAKTTDWLSYALKDGSISKHNIVISGGTEKIKYYLSGGYHNQTGTVPNSGMEEFMLRSNITAELTSFLRLTSVINANRNNYDNSNAGTNNGVGIQGAGALQHAIRLPPWLPLKDENGNYNIYQNIPNPEVMKQLDDKSQSGGLYLNFTADFDIIKNMLSAKLLYGNNREDSRRDTYIPSTVYFDQMYKSRGNLAYSQREHQTMEATVKFNRKFADILDFDAVLGIGQYKTKSNGMNVGYNEQYDAIANSNLSSVSGVKMPESYLNSDEKRSQFARLNFSIYDKYIINTTLRRDGTDKFFPGNKYALFPAVSVAWKVYEESFLRDVEWINLLKLRASYGVTGSDNLGRSLYGTYGPGAHKVPFNQNATIYTSIILNGLDYPNVTWEKTIMKNAGIDFYIFNNRISGSFDVYRNDVTNMLSSSNAKDMSLFSTYPINGGHIRRTGFDFDLRTDNIQGRDFGWNTYLNLSRVNAIWVERFPNYEYKDYELRKNIPVNIMYYYETEGIINMDMTNIPASQPEAGRLPGYPIIKDQNKDGQITINDIVHKNNIPDIYIGLGNTFRWKNLDLDIFAYSRMGTVKYNEISASPSGMSSEGPNQSVNIFKNWNSQTNPDGTWPGISFDLTPLSLPGGVGTNIRQENSSFVRIRNITMGYNFANNVLSSVGKYIRNIRLYVDCQNPFLFTKFGGYDPEIYTGGSGVGIQYPQTRTYSVGLDINF